MGGKRGRLAMMTTASGDPALSSTADFAAGPWHRE